MLRPTQQQLGVLGPFERVAFEVADAVNRIPLCKRVAQGFLHKVGREWVHQCTKNLVHIEGIEHLDALDPDRGVFLACNHRSFFDLYTISSVILRRTQWVERMYFPVRSAYFYERPDGVAVNALMSAMAMYPPIMREAHKKPFNQFSIELIKEMLSMRGTLVGYHPEGTRGRGPDPYALLRFGSGTGTIIHAARPIVLPAFILGLSNNFPQQVRGNFNGTGAPVTMVFGAPVPMDDLFVRDASPETHQAVSDRTREAMLALMPVEKAFRARLNLPNLQPDPLVPSVPGAPELVAVPPTARV